MFPFAGLTGRTNAAKGLALPIFGKCFTRYKNRCVSQPARPLVELNRSRRDTYIWPAKMAPSFDNLTEDEDFDLDEEIDFSDLREQYVLLPRHNPAAIQKLTNDLIDMKSN